MKGDIKKETKKESCAFCKFCIKDRSGQFYCIKKKKYFYPSVEQFRSVCDNFKRYS